MMFKKWVGLGFAVVLLLAVSACGGGTSFTADWVSVGNISNVTEEYKDDCQEVDYRDFDKNPDAHEGEDLYLKKATVLDISEDMPDMTTMTLGLGETGDEYDAVVEVTWPGPLENVYKGSVVDVWGLCMGAFEWGERVFPPSKDVS